MDASAGKEISNPLTAMITNGSASSSSSVNATAVSASQSRPIRPMIHGMVKYEEKPHATDRNHRPEVIIF